MIAEAHTLEKKRLQKKILHRLLSSLIVVRKLNLPACSYITDTQRDFQLKA